MSAPAVWLREADVVDALDLSAAVDAVASGFAAEAAGRAATMVKTHLAWAGGQLHAVGGMLDDVVGTKTWAHTAGGAQPLLVLCGRDGGRVLAVLEAFALGQMRTAAVSAVLTDHLAVADVDTMAMCGTGKQALAQVAAVAAVRPVRTVRVWSPNPERRAAFASRVEAELDLAAVDCGSAADACAGAEVVTVATRASEPFVASADISSGAHINAIGAITPERAELQPALVARCTVVADSVAQARELSAELRDAYGDDDAAWAGVRPLAEVVADGGGRPADADVTLGKAMGVGLADVAIGVACLKAAQALGRGAPLGERERVAPRLKVASRSRRQP